MPAIIKSFDGFVPQIGQGVYLADGAAIVGHVELGDYANVWYGAVLRGDLGPIRIGRFSTVQDLACLHMKRGGQRVEIGEYVSVGHGAVVHGAVIEDGVFVGHGCVLMDRVKIGARSVVAPGTLVARGTEIPPGVLVRGRPGKVKRKLKPEELAWGRQEAEIQAELASKAEA